MKHVLAFIFSIVSIQGAYCQDFSFSQFHQTPLLRNPALAGVFDGDVRVNAAFRSQWQNVTVPFQTGALSAELKLPLNNWNDWVTLGTQLSYDVAGDLQLKRTQLLPVVNVHKSLGGDADNYLSIALMFGPVTSQFDPTLLKFNDQFVNGVFSPNNPTAGTFSSTGKTYWDASTGISYSSTFGATSRFYVGGALFHFNKPNVGFFTSNDASILPSKYVVNAGFATAVNDVDDVSLFADYSAQSGNKQFIGGATYTTELLRNYDKNTTLSLAFGTFYRWNDAIIPNVRIDMYDVSVGVSYDINVSRLATVSQLRGGFELTAVYRARTRRSAEAGKVKCVRF